MDRPAVTRRRVAVLVAVVVSFVGFVAVSPVAAGHRRCSPGTVDEFYVAPNPLPAGRRATSSACRPCRRRPPRRPSASCTTHATRSYAIGPSPGCSPTRTRRHPRAAGPSCRGPTAPSAWRRSAHSAAPGGPCRRSGSPASACNRTTSGSDPSARSIPTCRDRARDSASSTRCGGAEPAGERSRRALDGDRRIARRSRRDLRERAGRAARARARPPGNRRARARRDVRACVRRHRRIRHPCRRRDGALRRGDRASRDRSERLRDARRRAGVASVIRTGCLDQITAAVLAIPLDGFYAHDPAVTQPAKALATANDVGRVRVDAPLFLVQGTADTTVVPQRTRDLFARLCSHGQVTKYLEVAGAGHGDVLARSLPEIQSWFADRLAGRPATTSCTPPVAPPTVVPGAGSVTEGDAGTTSLAVPLSLSWPTDETVTVQWHTVAVPGIAFPHADPTGDYIAGAAPRRSRPVRRRRLSASRCAVTHSPNPTSCSSSRSGTRPTRAWAGSGASASDQSSTTTEGPPRFMRIGACGATS